MEDVRWNSLTCLRLFTKLCPPLPQQPTEYFDMGIFLAFFVVVSLVCLILLIKIKLKQRRSQVIAAALIRNVLVFIERADGRRSR